MNLFLVVTSEGGSLTDILLLSITGIIVVILGLVSLSFVVWMFKHIFKTKQDVPVVVKEPKKSVEKKGDKSLSFKVSELDDDQLTAIFTALAIESKLYHEDEPLEPTFNYQPRNFSGWSIAGITKD